MKIYQKKQLKNLENYSMTINETFQEIALITQKIIENGLSIEEKWPNRLGSKISWLNQMDLSIALKNIPYSEKYEVLKADRNFNFKMVDGALIQMMYEYNVTGRILISHRLAFFPSPTLERYDNASEDYEELYFGASEFHDMIEKDTIAFPIRFDYDIDPEKFSDIDHPYSHATFGGFEHCRIPVNCALTPSIFINFILRNFYNYAFKTRGVFCEVSEARFGQSITNNESNILHFNITNTIL